MPPKRNPQEIPQEIIGLDDESLAPAPEEMNFSGLMLGEELQKRLSTSQPNLLQVGVLPSVPRAGLFPEVAAAAAVSSPAASPKKAPPIPPVRSASLSGSKKELFPAAVAAAAIAGSPLGSHKKAPPPPVRSDSLPRASKAALLERTLFHQSAQDLTTNRGGSALEASAARSGSLPDVSAGVVNPTSIGAGQAASGTRTPPAVPEKLTEEELRAFRKESVSFQLNVQLSRGRGSLLANTTNSPRVGDGKGHGRTLSSASASPMVVKGAGRGAGGSS